MKKTLQLFVIVIAISGSMVQLCRAQSLNNDLLLRKPMINTNEPGGGYYSELFFQSLQQLFCGAIIQNTGTQSASRVYLQLDLLDYNSSVLSTHYSDTVSVLDTSQVDTLNIQQAIIPDDNCRYISFRIISDSIDENEGNNADTILFTELWYSDWNQTSRADVATNTLDTSEVENFQSGDYIGIKIKFPSLSWHIITGLQVFTTEPWPDSLTMVAKIYQGDTVVSSVPVYPETNFTQPYWTYSSFDYDVFSVDLFSTFYVGVEISFPPGTAIPIGVDTSYFHNFKSETIARIGNTWTNLNFVPLIRLVCDPEGIEEGIDPNMITCYPNPAGSSLTIESLLVTKASPLTIMNAQGQLVCQGTFSGNKSSIDISAIAPGLYVLSLAGDEEGWVRRFVKE